MNMNETYKRRIRVEGGLDDTHGYLLKVYDMETGAEIVNVARIALVLDAKKINRANVVYYEMDENNKLVLKDGEPVIKVAILDNPDVSVTAFERYNNA
jgi:hypothetical protein